MEDQFWTFEDIYGIFDGEFKTKQEAQDYADAQFAERCLEDSPRNNESFNDEIFLIRACYDDEGEFKELERMRSTVDYEHFHGDYAEHGTWWSC